MKKFLSAVVAIFMIVTLTTPTFATSGDTFNDLTFTYTVTDEAKKTVSVSKNNDAIETCNIPETVENNGITYTVTEVKENGFRELNNLKTVNISDSVTIIGESAFSKCKELTSVHIPESVTTIGRAAFNECYKLESVNLPKKLTVLRQDIFHSCKSLTSITIPNNVTYIESNAFLGTGLTSIVIPGSVTGIAGSVFWDCNNLTSVILPNNISSLSSSVFNTSNSLKSVMAVTSNKTDSISTKIINVFPKNVKYYLGITDIKLNQTSVKVQPNDTLVLDTCFSVSTTVKDEKGALINIVTVPTEYQEIQYSLVSVSTGNTRIEGSKLIVDPQQKDNLTVKATLNKQEVELSVNIIQSPIKNIELSQKPRLAYTEGETFNPAGLELKVNYENRTSDIVEYNENTKNDFTFIVNSPLTLNDNKVVIKYANHSVEQALTIYRKAIIVSSDQNSVDGLEDKYEQGEVLNIHVKGAGMDNQTPVKGDIRYQPINWKISTEQKFEDKLYQITMNTKSLEVGTHQLVVTYQKEVFDGQKWLVQDTVIQMKKFEVVEVSQTEVAPKPEETQKTLPTQTEDTSFIIGFVALVIISVSIFLISFIKKKSKKMQ